MKLAISQTDALHQTRGGTNEVLSIYEHFLKSEQFKVDPILLHLIEVHERHAGELLERHSALGYSTDGESVEAFLPEGTFGPEAASSDSVNRGEQALLDIYQEALVGWAKCDDSETHELLDRQYQELLNLQQRRSRAAL